jgi:anti-anti-sigma factor
MDDVGAHEMPEMAFDVAETDAETVTVTISGELDLGNIERLDEAAARIIERRPARLVLELGDLRFADSSAIALWVRWARAVDRIELRGASPLLRRVVTTMGLTETLELKP